MATASARSGSEERLPAGAGPNGWLAFAGIVLFLNGVFGALWGLAAIVNDPVVTVGGGTGVIIWDFTAWGWIALILGTTMAVTAVGVFTGNGLARWLAVGFVGLHAITQFAAVPAFPLWSIFVIALDVVILYQLLVRWQLED